MHATVTTTVPDVYDTAHLAVAGYLARYTGRTREAYGQDLHQWFTWCADRQLDPLTAKRAHLELYGRWMEEARGNKPSTVHRRLTSLVGFYRMCEIDDVITKSPATYLRLPKIQTDETTTLGLDRLELSSLLAQARVGTPDEWALITLLGLLGLRVSEACAVQVDDYQGTERGHRVLRLVGKGGKPATMPLPVPVLRALDACADGRTTGQLLHTQARTPMNRAAATRAVRRLAKRAGITKRISPHSLRHAFVTNALDAGVPIRDVQFAARHSDPRQTVKYDRARGNLDRHAVHTLTAYVAGAA